MIDIPLNECYHFTQVVNIIHPWEDIIMASLREEARWVLEDARGGISWIAVWKTGRSWHCQTILGLEYEEGNHWLKRESRWTTDDPDDIATLREIFAEDENAILVNSYYCNLGGMEDLTLQTLVNALRWQYEDGGNLGEVIDELITTMNTEEGGAGDDGHQQAEAADLGQRTEDELYLRADRRDVFHASSKDYKRIRLYRHGNLNPKPALRSVRAGPKRNFFCQER